MDCNHTNRILLSLLLNCANSLTMYLMPYFFTFSRFPLSFLYFHAIYGHTPYLFGLLARRPVTNDLVLLIILVYTLAVIISLLKPWILIFLSRITFRKACFFLVFVELRPYLFFIFEASL